MTKQPNVLMIVTDQEHAHQSLPAGFVLPNSCQSLRKHRTRLVGDTDGEETPRREDRVWSEPDTSAKGSTR